MFPIFHRLSPLSTIWAPTLAKLFFKFRLSTETWLRGAKLMEAKCSKCSRGSITPNPFWRPNWLELTSLFGFQYHIGRLFSNTLDIHGKWEISKLRNGMIKETFHCWGYTPVFNILLYCLTSLSLMEYGIYF